MLNSLLNFSKSPILNLFLSKKEFSFSERNNGVKQYVWKSKKYGISLIVEQEAGKKWQVIILNKDGDVESDEELKKDSLTIAKSFLKLWNNEVLPFLKNHEDFEMLKCSPTTKSRQKLYKRAGFKVKKTKANSYYMYMNFK